MTLSKRLHTLADMVEPGYAAIWDCCCDHGYLGQALLQRKAAPEVHFVDVVPHLMQALEQRLQTQAPGAGWRVHCMDVAHIQLTAQPGRQLVIMAGIGGDLMTDLATQLAQANPHAEYDLLVCPVRQQFNLRCQLNTLGFGFKAEQLIRDNSRFYEMLLASSPAARTPQQEAVSAAGGWLWQHSPQAADYLAATLAHYRKTARGQRPADLAALEAYQAISLKRV